MHVACSTQDPRVVRLEDGGTVSREVVLEWELLAARRLIRLLRHAMGAENLVSALAPHIEESTLRMEALVATSKGVWRRASIRVECDDLSTTAFFAWWAKTAATVPALFLAANAEHVAHVVTGRSRPGIVEPLGGLPTALFFTFRPGQDIEPVDASYPHSVIGAGRVGSPEGPIATRCIHHFRDTEAGMEALLTLEVPAAASDQLVEEARQHLAIEFCRFMMMARAGTTELPPLDAMW